MASKEKMKKVFKTKRGDSYSDPRFNSNTEAEKFYRDIDTLRDILDDFDHFGVWRNTKRKYAIMLLWNDGTYRWVTDIFGHKEFKYEYDKPAYFFNSIRYAEDICSGMIINGYTAVVVTVPDVYDFEHFRNCKKEDVNTAK